MVPKSDMPKANQMNGLFPIIRRVRRPLLPVDVPADAKPAEPVKTGEGNTSKDSPVEAAPRNPKTIQDSDERS